MVRFFSRFVALLLIPCLLTDSVSASGWRLSPQQRAIASPFNEQALLAILVVAAFHPAINRNLTADVQAQVAQGQRAASWQNPAIQRTVSWMLDRMRIPGTPLVRSYLVPDPPDAALARIDPAVQDFLRRDFANTYDLGLALIIAVKSDREARAREFIDYYDQRSRVPSRANVEGEIISGEVIWIGMGAAHYVHRYGPYGPALRLMTRVDDYLRSQQQPDGRIKGGPAVTWTSTEHNEDALAYLTMRYLLTRNPDIDRMRTGAARWFVSHAYLPGEKRFRRGHNDNVYATDTQTWGVQIIKAIEQMDPDFYRRAGLNSIDLQGVLNSLDQRVLKTQTFVMPNGRRVALPIYGFSESGPGSVEWSWENAISHLVIGNLQKAQQIARNLIQIELADGAYPYATSAGKSFLEGGWTVTTYAAQAATAHSLFFKMGEPPFLLAGPVQPLAVARTQTPPVVENQAPSAPRNFVQEVRHALDAMDSRSSEERLAAAVEFQKLYAENSYALDILIQRSLPGLSPDYLKLLEFQVEILVRGNWRPVIERRLQDQLAVLDLPVSSPDSLRKVIDYVQHIDLEMNLMAERYPDSVRALTTIVKDPMVSRELRTMAMGKLLYIGDASFSVVYRDSDLRTIVESEAASNPIASELLNRIRPAIARYRYGWIGFGAAAALIWLAVLFKLFPHMRRVRAMVRVGILLLAFSAVTFKDTMFQTLQNGLNLAIRISQNADRVITTYYGTWFDMTRPVRTREDADRANNLLGELYVWAEGIYNVNSVNEAKKNPYVSNFLSNSKFVSEGGAMTFFYKQAQVFYMARTSTSQPAYQVKHDEGFDLSVGVDPSLFILMIETPDGRFTFDGTFNEKTTHVDFVVKAEPSAQKNINTPSRPANETIESENPSGQSAWERWGKVSASVGATILAIVALMTWLSRRNQQQPSRHPTKTRTSA